MIRLLVRLALTQRVLVLVGAVALAVGGARAFTRMPIDAFPDISVPQVQVIVKAPGLSPIEVEQGITTPIEVEMRGIARLATLRSLTKYALSVVTLDFEEDVDVYWARSQVSERLARVWDVMPPGAEGDLAPITTPLGEAFMFTLEGPGRSNAELRTILDWTIRPRLVSVDGVAEVNSLGGEVRAFEVVPDPDRLVALALTADDVAQAIERNNRNAGGDRIVRSDEVLLVRTQGRLRSIEDLERITVTSRAGAPIRLTDLADVRLGSLTRFGGVTKDGRGEYVQGLVLTRLGANSRETVDRVKATLDDVIPSLPAGVRIVPFYDRTDLVQRAVTMVRNALGLACALVLLVLLAFMCSLRGAVAVAVVLPMAVLTTFLLMHALGLTANLMSLGGLVIAIGILVDPAVVVVENVQARLTRTSRGHDRLHQIYRAVTEVGSPVVSGTAIIIIVFLPLLSLSGLEGRMFAPLAQTISIALAVAVLLALVFVPVVASLLLRPAATRAGPLVRIAASFHGPLVDWAIRRRWVALGSALALMVPAAIAFGRIGAEFIPRLEEGTLVIQTSKLPSISLERSLEIDGRIQRAILEQPEVAHVVSRLGSDELRLDPMGLHESDHYLVTLPESQWEATSEEELTEQLRARLESIPGVSFGFTQPIEMRTSEMITGVTAALAVKVFGLELDELEQHSAAIERVVAETEGTVDVMRAPLSGQTYLEVRADVEALSRFGVNTEKLNELVETAIGGRVVTTVTEKARRIDVLLRFPAERRSSPESIGALLVDTPAGARVPLNRLAHIVEVDGPVQLDHENGIRHVVIEANVEGRDIVGLVDELQATIADRVPLPPGYYVEFGGQFENQRRAARRLALVIPVALGLIFLILFSTFGCLRHAALILCNIPFALIGGVAALYLSGLYLSVPASVGFIALFGTALLNGIVMVSTFNQLQASGTPLDQAVRLGARRRLAPVLMTAVTTALGLLPLLLATGPGSDVQRPLAVVVVGGLFTSTLLTLVLVPSLYAWLEQRASLMSKPEVAP
ncbi:MAG: efflux RND transporter permease subunit [bacterium]|nr:efflux RND transporter permease subunit [bacterium]